MYPPGTMMFASWQGQSFEILPSSIVGDCWERKHPNTYTRENSHGNEKDHLFCYGRYIFKLDSCYFPCCLSWQVCVAFCFSNLKSCDWYCRYWHHCVPHCHRHCRETLIGDEALKPFCGCETFKKIEAAWV